MRILKNFIPIFLLVILTFCSRQVDDDSIQQIELQILSDQEAEIIVSDLFNKINEGGIHSVTSNLLEVSSEKTFIIDESPEFSQNLKNIMSLFISNEFNVSQEVSGYIYELDSEIRDKYKQGIFDKSQTEYLLSYLKILTWISRDLQSQEFMSNLKENPFLRTNGISVRCFFSLLATFGSSVGCIISLGWGCLGIPASVLSTINNCESIDDVDPNLPGCGQGAVCCGISCAAGYTCDGYGNCVPDPNFQGCPKVPCPSGYGCNSKGECVPY